MAKVWCMVMRNVQLYNKIYSTGWFCTFRVAPCNVFGILTHLSMSTIQNIVKNVHFPRNFCKRTFISSLLFAHEYKIC